MDGFPLSEASHERIIHVLLMPCDAYIVAANAHSHYYRSCVSGDPPTLEAELSQKILRYNHYAYLRSRAEFDTPFLLEFSGVASNHPELLQARQRIKAHEWQPSAACSALDQLAAPPGCADTASAYMIGVIADLNASVARAGQSSNRAGAPPPQDSEDEEDFDDLAAYFSLKYASESASFVSGTAATTSPVNRGSSAQTLPSLTQAARAARSLADQNKSDCYYLDSGASNHFFSTGIAHDARWIEQVSVRTAGPACVKASTYSHHQFDVAGYRIGRSGEATPDTRTIKLTTVTHSSSLTADLLSVSKLTREHNSVAVMTATGGAVLFGKVTFFVEAADDGTPPFQLPLTLRDGLYCIEPQGLNEASIAAPRPPLVSQTTHAAHAAVQTGFVGASTFRVLHASQQPASLPAERADMHAGTDEAEPVAHDAFEPLPVLTPSEPTRPLHPFVCSTLPTPVTVQSPTPESSEHDALPFEVPPTAADSAPVTRLVRAWASLTYRMRITYAQTMSISEQLQPTVHLLAASGPRHVSSSMTSAVPHELLPHQ
jgi:hypothetical protein